MGRLSSVNSRQITLDFPIQGVRLQANENVGCSLIELVIPFKSFYGFLFSSSNPSLPLDNNNNPQSSLLKLSQPTQTSSINITNLDNGKKIRRSLFERERDSLNGEINKDGLLSSTQLQLTLSRVELDQCIRLAVNPNKLNNAWRVNSKAKSNLADKYATAFLISLNRKRITKAVDDVVSCILGNLVGAIGNNSQVIYSRDKTSKAGVLNQKLIIEFSDYLHRVGLIINEVAPANQYSGIKSYMFPTEKLESEVKLFEATVSIIAGKAVEVRGVKPIITKLIPDNTKGKPKGAMKKVKIKGKAEDVTKRMKYRHPKAYRESCLPVDAHNKIMTNHLVTLDGNYLIPYGIRIYNNGSFKLGGRFYGSTIQGLPSKDRKRILIDGERTVEPDFKGHHYCILYAEQGYQLDPVLNDPYKVDDFDRDTIKLANLSLLNANSESGFKACITKSGNPDNKRINSWYNKQLKEWQQDTVNGVKRKAPTKPDLLKGWIDNMPDHTNGTELYNAIAAKHSLIADQLGSDDMGLKLQNIDSNIMGEALLLLAGQDIPAQAVHDSIRCREKDLELVVVAMKNAYRKVTKFECVITCELTNGKETVWGI